VVGYVAFVWCGERIGLPPDRSTRRSRSVLARKACVPVRVHTTYPQQRDSLPQNNDCNLSGGGGEMRDVPFVAARMGPPLQLGSRVPATPTTHTRFPNRAKRPTNFRTRSKITREKGVENGLGKEDIEDRVGYAVNLLRTSHKLILNDPASKPMGLAIWYVNP
jgi:hypothetical protein